MSSHNPDVSSGALDSQFDRHLVDMKPFVLNLPQKAERQRCAQWIQKLCDPRSCGSGRAAKTNRNSYAELLLNMLRGGVLEAPFARAPRPGVLTTLPAYMNIYYEQTLRRSSTRLPLWPSDQLDQTLHTGSSSHRRTSFSSSSSPARPSASSPVKQSSPRDEKMARGMKLVSDDRDFETRFNSWNLGIENPRYLRERSVSASPASPPSPGHHRVSQQTSEVSSWWSPGRSGGLHDDSDPLEADTELRMKSLEARHQEETLRMQQKHDAETEKILERKNSEMEALKSTYDAKQKEMEDTVRRLEKRVQSLLRESQVIQQTKEKQISELKKMSDQSAESLKNEWEKKLHAVVSGMEQEKFALQKKHTENIQELLEDTNQRLSKMESEYSGQTRTTEQLVHELETRVQQLSVEVETGNLLRMKVLQEKAELEISITSISSELQEAEHRKAALQKEMRRVREEHEDAVKKLQLKQESDMVCMRQEMVVSAAKASEQMEDLEQTTLHLRQQLQDSESRRLSEIREHTKKTQQELADLHNASEKQLQTLQAELETERAHGRRKISKMEECLREREEQLSRAADSRRQQVQEAELALEKMKKQAELSSEKTYAQMKLQMEKVECDLLRSKSLREHQSEEFSRQIVEQQHKHQQQMVELKLQHEQERTHLLHAHSAEKDSLVQDHQRQVQGLDQQRRAAMVQQQERRRRDAQTIRELEEQVHSLRKELLAAHGQRQQQSLESAALRDEEQKRLRAEMDQLREELERSHKVETELTKEKTSSRLKQLERQHQQNISQSAKVMSELQASLSSGRQTQLSLEKKLQEAQTQWDEERKHISQVLEERVETLQKQLHRTEKKLKNRELEFQQQVTLLQQECELRMKGLMPAELQQELEDTITSLKSQISFLQKRATVLQQEIDACRLSR